MKPCKSKILISFVVILAVTIGAAADIRPLTEDELANATGNMTDCMCCQSGS